MIRPTIFKGFMINACQMGSGLISNQTRNFNSKLFVPNMQKITTKRMYQTDHSIDRSARLYQLTSPGSTSSNSTSPIKMSESTQNEIKTEIQEQIKERNLSRASYLLRYIPSSPSKDQFIVSLIPDVFKECERQYAEEGAQLSFIFDWYVTGVLDQAELGPDKILCIEQCLEKIQPYLKQNPAFDSINENLRKQLKSSTVRNFENRQEELLKMGEYQICIELIEKETPNSHEKIGLLKKLAFKLAEDAKPTWTHSQPGKPIATPTFFHIRRVLQKIEESPEKNELIEQIINKLAERGYEKESRKSFADLVIKKAPPSTSNNFFQRAFHFLNNLKK